MIKFLDFIKDAEARKKEYMSAFDRVLESGWYILGNEVTSFEKELAEYLGIKHCIGVANGLEALQISLMALGVGKGDEVITTPVSAVATTLAIIAVGAKPVFVDVNDNGQIDASKIEEKITSKTKAVLPVHLYGQPCEIDTIQQICNKYKLFLIEDAAQAHGTTYKGKKVGTFGIISGFSFYPTKNLGAMGDGGAIVTNDDKLNVICREIRDYGQKSKYIHTRYGLNSRLDEIQAALLRVKLKYLDEDNNKRRNLAKEYIRNLSAVKGIQIILQTNVDDSIFHIFAIRTKKRDELRSCLEKNGIQTLIHYPLSISDQPFLKGIYKECKIPVSRRFVNEVISLPCYPDLSLENITEVSKEIQKFINS